MPILPTQIQPRVTTADQAFNAILQAIIEGSLPDGSPLILKDLATDLSMSMMPIREALRQLEAAGLVEMEAHKGARVRPKSSGDLRATYQARLLIEGELCRLAALSGDTESLANAERLLGAQQRALAAGDHAAARAAHEQFHFAIYGASQSTWLLRSMQGPWQNSERYRLRYLHDSSLSSDRHAEHERIIEACRLGQGDEAREALTRHLMAVVRLIDPAVFDSLSASSQ